VRGKQLSVGLHAMAVGIAASASALVFISGGTPARSSDGGSGVARPSLSVFGTIHPELAQFRVPVGAQAPRVQLASLETDFTPEMPASLDDRQMTEPTAPADGASFVARFNSSFGERSSSFEERFATRTADSAPKPDWVQPPQTLALTEPDSDIPLPPEAPKRQNIRLASLGPLPSVTAGTRASVGTPSRSDAMSPEPGSRTAIYDITARVLYMPNGERLEAHSGLGDHMDDPRTVAVKNKGVTPPNVYQLSMREQLFHGVRAIRLTPVDPDKMFGRDGILAHPYMLRPNGESNGCVSIADYPKFLNAFLNGEVDRLVVVERLADPPATTAAAWLERLKAFFKSS
jgi:Protein of unknown function (DUF2778)